ASQDGEKVRPSHPPSPGALECASTLLCSRITQKLNVRPEVRLASSFAAASPDDSLLGRRTLKVLSPQAFSQLFSLCDCVLHRRMFPAPVSANRIDAASFQLGQHRWNRSLAMFVEQDIGIVQILGIGDDQLVVWFEDPRTF